MAIKHNNIFHSKTLQKYIQIGNFGLQKYHLGPM
jgi:hypothetical protein